MTLNRIYYFFIIVVFVFSSCATSSVVMDIQRPADITIDNDIRNFVVVNRVRPTRGNLANNIVEGILSGEEIGVDRKGAKYCVQGLFNMLEKSERFKIKNIEAIELQGTGTSSFPVPLDWNEVKSICGSYQADALIVLETFDSNSEVILGNPRVKNKKVKGVKVKQTVYPSTLVVEVEAGWRIYHVDKKEIIDENKFKDIKRFTASGNNPKQAELNLPSKSTTVKESGIFAGHQYGLRISPVWINVSRRYYSSKYDEFKEAKKYIDNNDWNGAIDVWKPLTSSDNKKLAGKSCFNMALASEIHGQLDVAIDWIKKSHKFGEKRSFNYLRILEKRKSDSIKLEKQLNNN
jgi:hypothetical protein